MDKKLFIGILLTASALPLNAVYAQTPHSPWEKGSLQIGGFINTMDSELRLDSDTLGRGTTLNLEDGLGLDSDETTYRIDALYRFSSSRRHQIEAHYYNTDREGSRLLSETVQIGDVVFPAGSGVVSNLELWFLNIDYSYAFVQNERFRIAGAIGLHTTGIDFRIATTGGALSEEEQVTAPLPVVGLRGDWALSERWRLKGSVDVFYLEYDNYEGGLADATVAVEYLPFKNVGFGLGVNGVRYQVEGERDSDLADFSGKVQLDFVGALLYVKLFF